MGNQCSDFYKNYMLHPELLEGVIESQGNSKNNESFIYVMKALSSSASDQYHTIRFLFQVASSSRKW